MRLVIIQYGDYYKALQNRDNGIQEEYRCQYYSLNVIDNLLDGNECLIICLSTLSDNCTNNIDNFEHCIKYTENINEKKEYNIYERQYKNYHLLYGDFIHKPKTISHSKNKIYKFTKKCIHFVSYKYNNHKISHILKQAIKNFKPSHVIIRTSGWVLGSIGRWCIKQDIHILPLLADYEMQSRLRKILSAKHIKVMQSSKIPLISNHNYPASQSLVNLGVPSFKVVPWDWPSPQHPTESKKYTSENKYESNIFSILYVGMLRYDKGVGDILQAMAIINNIMRPKTHNIHYSIHICGDGPDKDALMLLAKELQLYDRIDGNDIVHFHGLVSNTQVKHYMGKAKLVIVPSWHSYPEGMPNVIYESLESYTPIIISNHPSFLGRLENGKGCLIVEGKNQQDIANAIIKLTNYKNYKRVTEGIIEAWQNIQCPVLFEDILFQWRDFTEKNVTLECLQYCLLNKKL